MNCLCSHECWDRGFESHSRHGCLYASILFYVVLFVVNGLRRTDPPSKESYRLCIRLGNWKNGQGPTKDCRAIDISIEWQYYNLPHTPTIPCYRQPPYITVEVIACEIRQKETWRIVPFVDYSRARRKLKWEVSAVFHFLRRPLDRQSAYRAGQLRWGFLRCVNM
jgi:hypothetical protein